MKKFYLLLLLISASSFYAQSTAKEFEQLAEAEMKSAHQRMTFVTNPNTWNYDVKYHRLDLTIDPSELFVSGEVTTHFVANENMNTVTFDLSSALDVSSVVQRGDNLTFTQNGNDELIITLPVTQNLGVLDSLRITYSGIPVGSGFGSFITDEHNGTPVMWTLSEPFGALEWWPCKQDLNDKVDNIDVYITAPTIYNSVANGLQQSKTNNGNGTSTTHFKHNYPIAAYLIAIACTNYQTFTNQGGLGTVASPFFPIINYMYPETAAANQASVAITPTIMNFYESIVGNYPFRNEKYGHCQFGWGGGMEHQTVSFMTANDSGAYSRSLIAHELGHQWFGDKVTCGSWKDIWLNEGFATYMASMTIEELDGEEAFITNKGNMINTIVSQPDGAIYLTDDQALDVGRIFNSRLSYNKGAMVLNMLRFKMGDANFFQGLQNYLNDPDQAYAYATTPDLQAHLEATSGMDLTEFFNDWVYNEGYPIYDIVARNISAGQARITINQNQSDNSVSFFEMPVPIRLFGAGGQEQDIVLNNTTDGQIFNIAVPFALIAVQFNPKNDIISDESVAILANESFDMMDGVSLYPNPATNKLTLQLPTNVIVERTVFYNALGQKTKETVGDTSWDISSLASGVYFIKVITNSGTKQIKFIKQ